MSDALPSKVIRKNPPEINFDLICGAVVKASVMIWADCGKEDCEHCAHIREYINNAEEVDDGER